MNQLTVAIGLLFLCAIGRGESKKSARTIPCKTPEVAKSCYWMHGRLAVANGNPSYRLWKVGTRRLLGIHSGPAVYNGPLRSKYPLDNEGPELPPNVEASLWRSVDSAWPNVIYADFEVCPLDKEQPEAMQPACIESAKKIVVSQDTPRNKKP